MSVRLVLKKKKKSQTKPNKQNKETRVWCLIPDRPVERYVLGQGLLVLLGHSLGLLLSITLMGPDRPLRGCHRAQGGTGMAPRKPESGGPGPEFSSLS